MGEDQKVVLNVIASYERLTSNAHNFKNISLIMLQFSGHVVNSIINYDRIG